MEFTQNDKTQFAAKNISEETVTTQLNCFNTGFPYINLERACVPTDGIIVWDTDEIERLLEMFESYQSTIDFLKFVPASGAASRMFKHLFSYQNGNEDALVTQFFENIEKFAFYTSLKKEVEKGGEDFSELMRSQNYERIIHFLLSEEGLSYGQLPKGLIDFHLYNGEARKAVAEHLLEGVQYAMGDDGVVRIHFTISESHKNKFQEYLKPLINKISGQYSCEFEIDYSVQSPVTDTIAVEMDNTPFRLENGSILFRPGGHGALIQNLNQLDADVIFIKNIDNVVPEKLQPTTITFKKAIASKLLELKAQRDYYLTELNKEEASVELEEILGFCQHQLNLDTSSALSKTEVIDLLDRPMRICGMVKNEGEPGGGPFWVKDPTGKLSIQIVEKSQIDVSNEFQREILEKSTHFNPVDLVCATKNHEGESYNLLDFVDPDTGFIAEKSLEGRKLKAQELPGLWNGAMAKWITLFVEVPLITFNPVKTVNDLLKPNHQSA